MTLTEIETKVAEWLNREDLTLIIPTWLDFVMRELERMYNFSYMSKPAVLNDVSTYLAPLPADYKAIKSAFVLDGNGDRQPLMKTISRYAFSQFPGASNPNIPEMIAVVNYGSVPGTATGFWSAGLYPDGADGEALTEDSSRVLLIRPTPDATYDFEITYYAKSSAISDSHWLVINAPDVLLYGALVESAPYLKDDPRIPVWETKMNSRVMEILREDNKEKFDGSPQYVKSGGPVI